MNQENTEGAPISVCSSYIEAGIKPLRLHQKTKRPVGEKWQVRPVDIQAVERWAEEGNPIGWQLGEVSGWIAAIDNDTPEAEALAPLFLPDTLKIAKGDHRPSVYVYRSEGLGYSCFDDPCDDPRNAKRLLDVKASNNGKGHQIVVPPSEHKDKGPYRFVGVEEFDPSYITEVDRDELWQCVARLVAATAIARHLPDGGRHDLAMAITGFLARHGGSEEVVGDVLHAAWHYNGAPEEAHRDIDGLVEDTFENLARGEKVTGGPTLAEKLGDKFPSLLAKAFGFNFSWKEERAAAAAAAGRKKKTNDEDEPPTHDELRDRWLAENPDYAYGLEEWRHYENGIWPPVETPIVRQSVVEVLEGAKDEGIKPSVFILNSVHELARTKTYVKSERWDSDPGILVAQNCAINLTTGGGIPHSKKHYATSAVPYDFDADAEAQNWCRFIASLDEDVAAYLQEFAGYTLTTDTSLEKAVWFIGPPGGGKSTFLEGLNAVLGVRAGVLGLNEIERSRFSLAKLVGKTLVTAAEQPAGFISCHHILQSIISGEPIEVERKYRDPYDLIPRAKICWAMNEAPRIPTAAEGLFRRVDFIEFPEIPKEARDPTLKEGIKTEGAGILNWALEGLGRLNKRGDFDVPDKITTTNNRIRQDNDPVSLFVEERCKKGEGLRVKSSKLYKEYKWWCEDTGHKAKNSTTIAQDWKRLGFKKDEKKDGNYWLGVEVDDSLPIN